MTIYSTNPKMDTSGITAKQPRSEYVPTKNGGKEVPLEPRLEERDEAKTNYNTCSYWDK